MIAQDAPAELPLYFEMQSSGKKNPRYYVEGTLQYQNTMVLYYCVPRVIQAEGDLTDLQLQNPPLRDGSGILKSRIIPHVFFLCFFNVRYLNALSAGTDDLDPNSIMSLDLPISHN